MEAQMLRDDRKIIGISQDTPIILSQEITYIEKIGGGQYGSVFLGTCRGKEVAIKKFFKQDLAEKSVTDFKKEVEICCRIHHPNVVLFMGACIEPGNLAIVTELVPKGNLESLLHDPNRHYSLFSRIKMALDIAKGMNWLHCSKPPIIHRDLKPSNLLVDEYDNIKVCDFGFSTIRTSSRGVVQQGTMVGSPLWMAPEVMQGKPISEKADVYSFGIVFWEMVTQSEPFPEIETFKQLEEEICVHEKRPDIPEQLPHSIKEMMMNCWHSKPNYRPSFSEIIDRFPELLMDCAINDPTGKLFWRKCFAIKDFVYWEDFVSEFYSYFINSSPDTNSPQFKCLKLLLAKKSPDNTLKKAPEIVSLEAFGNLLSWFGPLDSVPDASSNILEYIKSIVKQKWFHGQISMTDASNRLSSYSKGHFLIRLSSTVPGQFTISKVDKANSISHQRITYSHNLGFSVRLKDAKTGAVKVLSENGIGLKRFISKIASDFGLVTPCPGRSAEFEQIFMKPKSVPLAGYIMDSQTELLPSKMSDNS
eukprot:TRINITY_DN1755_c0_g2_i1.p1 TRINITY_DN1755_c0_g2~~TRINITY_DN1755_c0_g2_i1.p1  ORF type:complete len:532 (-),score=88.92 TRINITY_DN1755_c0_g2_i1:288-1883(-)